MNAGCHTSMAVCQSKYTFGNTCKNVSVAQAAAPTMNGLERPQGPGFESDSSRMVISLSTPNLKKKLKKTLKKLV